MFRTILIFLLILISHSQAFSEVKITYYHYDLLGSPIATTNQDGDIIWREEYGPWGEKLLNEDAEEEGSVRGYTGHVHDKETGLTYMQARYYDPQIGRFMGVDPIGFQEKNTISFNRYNYANNNPYKFVDPNGMEPDDHVGGDFGDPIGFGNDDMSDFHEMSSFFGDSKGEGIQGGGPASIAEFAVGSLKLGTFGYKGLKALWGGSKRIKHATKRGMETIQRAMSRRELEAIQNLGMLSRGGRDGPHFASNAVNSTANRARQRLALPGSPEVRVTMDVPKDVFSSPSKVKPKFNMSGGGMERTAPGHLDIPATIRRVDGL